MLSLSLMLPNEVAEGLLALAKTSSMPIDETALELIRKGLAIETNAPPTALWEAVVMSCERVANVEPGTEFLLADVVDPKVWEKLAPGDRKQVGKKFRQQIEKNGTGKFVRRRSDNHAIYVRT